MTAEAPRLSTSSFVVSRSATIRQGRLATRARTRERINGVTAGAVQVLDGEIFQGSRLWQSELNLIGKDPIQRERFSASASGSARAIQRR